MGIAGGVMGYLFSGIDIFKSVIAPTVVSWSGLVLIFIIGGIPMLWEDITNKNFKGAGKKLLPVALPYLIILIIFSFWLGMSDTITTGFILGFYLSAFLVWLHTKTMNPVEVFDATKEVKERLLDELKTINHAISGIEKIIANGGYAKKAKLEKDEKEAIEKFGFLSKGRYDVNTLKETLDKLKNMKTIIESKLDTLYETTYKKVIEEK